MSCEKKAKQQRFVDQKQTFIIIKSTNLRKTVTRFGSLPPIGTPKTTALEEGASKVAVTQSNVEFTKFITKIDAILLEISIQFATRLQTSLVFKHMHCNRKQKHQGPAYKDCY